MTQRTIVLHPVLKNRTAPRDAEFALEEAVGLARAIDLEIVESRLVTVRDPRPSTLLGEGKITELGDFIGELEIGLAVIDTQLSPVQQRNLEQAWKCKVIDRTALILEIFGERAHTREGQLQVELASLEYQKSRLVRSWTHLERQRGGFGFLGGPGESQIETDRRLIRDRIAKIRRQLETITRTRELHRKVRRDVPYPLVALVGYTNAGKSTLFNRLTGAGVDAVDKLFATLDPTIRALTLPSGLKIMLSDTVGFVSNLPTELVAAFRATLEEVLEADLLIHVRDCSHPETEQQKEDVLHVLDGLFQQNLPQDRILEVLNKTDRLGDEMRHSLTSRQDSLAVSALSGDGVDELLRQLDLLLSNRFRKTTTFDLGLNDGKNLAWLHQHGTIISQISHEDRLEITVAMTPENIARFRKNLQH